jgi:hypothetical protein
MIMQKHKKGQQSHTINLILIVGSAIVLLLFFGGWMLTRDGEDKIKTCQLSVITQAGTSFGIIDKDSPFDINCNKRYVTFYNTKVELGYSPEDMDPIPVKRGNTQSKKFTELNELIVNQVIAEELRICKFQFGDGKIDLFPNDDRRFLGKSTCFVCSEISFETGSKEKVFTELKEFTKQTTYSDEGISYYDYLTEQTRFNASMWEQAVLTEETEYSTMPISTSQKYLIYVERYKHGKGKILLWTSVPGIVINILTRDKDSISVGIVPDKNINDICDIQAS